MLIANKLILYFAAAAKEATGKPFYFLKYTEPTKHNPKNTNSVALIYYAALDGDRLVLLHDNTDQSFSTYHHKCEGSPEPFKITDHHDVIRAIKHVYGLSNCSAPIQESYHQLRQST